MVCEGSEVSTLRGSGWVLDCRLAIAIVYRDANWQSAIENCNVGPTRYRVVVLML